MSAPPADAGPIRTALVTGGHGLIGSWLVRALLARGVHVVVLARDPARAAAIAVVADADAPGDAAGRSTTVGGDLLDPGTIARALAEHAVDTVFHLAGRTLAGEAMRDPVATYETNVRGTWLLLEACRAHGARRVLVASTDRVYGTPARQPVREDAPLLARLPYDVSRACADLIARTAWEVGRLPVAVARCTNVYGGGDRHRSRLVPELVGAALAGRPPVIHTDGSPERRYLHAEDAAAAYLALADALGRPGAGGVGGEAFNLAGDRLCSVRELAERVIALAGSPVRAEYRGAAVAPEAVDRYDLETAKLRAATGWAPRVDLDEGLRRTLAWYREHPEALAP